MKWVIAVTVYVDLLFLLNLIINTLVLAGAVALGRERMHLLRLLSAAGIGAFYSVLIFFPQLSFVFRTGLRLLVGALMVAVGIPTASFKRYLRALLWFYLCLGVFGGGMYLFYALTPLGAQMLYSGGVFYVDMPLWLLLLLSFSFYGLVRLAAFVKCRQPLQTLEKIEICVGGRYRTLTAFVDTGNTLVDPMTLAPVIIVEAAALKGVLPERLLTAVKTEDAAALEQLARQFSSLKCRLIPFQSVGESGGVMFAVRPDWIRTVPDGEPRENVLLGLCRKKLSPDNTYQALLQSHSSMRC